MYDKKYAVEEQRKHSIHCGKCPILEYAKENNNGWDFLKCSSINCWKLTDKQYLENKKKTAKLFPRRNHAEWELDDLGRLALNLKSIIHLVDRGWEQKEIAREYGCSQATMCAFLKKNKIKTGFSFERMFKNLPQKYKFSDYGERRKKFRFNLNDQICMGTI